MRDLGNNEVRKVVVCKLCYSHYCSNCIFKIHSEWERNGGSEYGWIGVVCCMFRCKFGIGDEIPLGVGIDFNPSMFWQPYIIIQKEF